MKVNGTTASKKDCIRMDKIQSWYFGYQPLTDYQLNTMSRRAIYDHNAMKFCSMPKFMQHNFEKWLMKGARRSWKRPNSFMKWKHNLFNWLSNIFSKVTRKAPGGRQNDLPTSEPSGASL